MATPTIASRSNGSLLDCQSPFEIKLVLLGATGVGKSSLVLRFVKDRFFEYLEATIGAAYLTYAIKVDNRTVKFEMWDTSGPERYDSLAPMYYRRAQAAIILYDITNMDSFHKAKSWVKELQSQACPNTVIALSGNKADLASMRKVQFQEAQVYAQENNLLFMETSALTAQNATEIFVAVGGNEVPPKVITATIVIWTPCTP
eukprot:Em0048g19a